MLESLARNANHETICQLPYIVPDGSDKNPEPVSTWRADNDSFTSDIQTLPRQSQLSHNEINFAMENQTPDTMETSTASFREMQPLALDGDLLLLPMPDFPQMFAFGDFSSPGPLDRGAASSWWD